MSLSRQGPSPATLRWVEQSLPRGARVLAARRMTGGIASVVHRLTIDDGASRYSLILRQYERADADTADRVERELATLAAVHPAGLPAPAPVAADPDGSACGGRPSLVMTRVPGRIDLAPSDPDAWVRQVAAMAARIHAVALGASPFLSRSDADADAPTVPSSAVSPALWTTAFDVLRQPAPDFEPRFLHRDYQHFNLLWRRGGLCGVVDWTTACTGPTAFDIGHCRLNLAVLFGAASAERLREAYEALTGGAVEPWWDLYAVAAYDDDWRRFIPLQVAGRVPVDVGAMTGQVERLIESILGRL